MRGQKGKKQEKEGAGTNFRNETRKRTDAVELTNECRSGFWRGRGGGQPPRGEIRREKNGRGSEGRENFVWKGRVQNR